MNITRVPRDINGRVRDMRGGALGILARKEADIVSAGALVRSCRLDEFDYVFCRLFLRVDLYYRLTPDLVGRQKTATFLAPLAANAWLALLLVLVVIIASLVLQGKSMFGATWDSIRLFVVQSFAHIEKYRIILLTSLYLVVVLFNIYSTSLLRIILTPPIDMFKSVGDVLQSLFITRIDIFFVGVTLKLATQATTNVTFHDDYYTAGRDPRRQPKNRVTIFKDGIVGIEQLRQGHVAFAAEAPTVNFAIKSNYTPQEICEIRRKNLMNDQLYYVLGKHSEYTEMFKLGLMKADEGGLVKRALQFYASEFPKCAAPVSVYSVPLWKIEGAFKVLICEYSFLRLSFTRKI